ncbi:MAG: DUF4395 domain-containing protein [Candidatus Woesearchaeota archaeon]
MKNIFYFGEKIKGYTVRVLNEREARAGAGILFFFAVFAFANAWFLSNFDYIKIFVTAFLIDFTIRVFVNPKFAPSLIIGRFFVSNQDVEWVGAPQKRFAWSIGFAMSLMMFFLLVVFDVRGLINLAICSFCLILLFFETSFGICIGCKIYNLIYPGMAKHCPGGVCSIKRKEEVQRISATQIIITISVLLIIFSFGFLFIL